jgi:hypothetical protein
MITKLCNSQNFIPISIWADYLKLYYLDIEIFTLSNDSLVNAYDLFESSTYASNEKLN